MSEASESKTYSKRNLTLFCRLGEWKVRFVVATATMLMIGLILSSCATSPTGRKQLAFLPDDHVNEMGAAAFDEMKTKTPVSRDAKANAYVKCIAADITAALGDPQGWEVIVFENADANAFALPGKKIGVHTGMLKVAKTPSQLAAVMGHEVGHVTGRHSNERLSEAQLVQGGTFIASALFKDKESKTYAVTMAALGIGAQFGLVLPHSRTQESEADIIGLELMAKAGFDPRQSVDLWKNMAAAGGGQPPEFMSTHPSHGTRIENLSGNMAGPLAIYENSGKRSSCKL